jgi:hypothetical protein
MKRLLTATALAATFAVGLAAQATTTAAQDPQTPGGQRGGGPRTVTGCLRAGDTAGTYMLTDVQMQGGGRRGGDTTAGSTTGATGSTAAGGTGSTAAGATGSTGESGRAMAPQSITLNAGSDVDLKAHVGHKVEVTGTMAGGRGGAGTTAGGGSTAGSTTTGGGTAAGGMGGTGGGTTASGGQGGRGARSLTVTNVRMISDSCS